MSHEHGNWVILLPTENGVFVMGKDFEWRALKDAEKAMLLFPTNGSAKQYARDRRMYNQVRILPLPRKSGIKRFV